MIYLDGHSTTPIDPRVFEAMRPYFLERFGNASHGLHSLNWEAQAGLELAREKLAQSLGATPRELIFTGGATEANHLALLGVESALRARGRTRILSLRIEHASVLGPLEILTRRGFTVEWISVGPDGRVDLADLASRLAPRTGAGTDVEVGLVSVALANHEIGTIQDLSEISRLAHVAGAWVHSDAVQAFGKIPFTVDSIGADLLTLSAHKIHGPKGAGVLYVRRKNPRVELEPLFLGGGQERGLRPGTPNTPALFGFGVAAEIARGELTVEAPRLAALRDLLWRELSTALPCLIRNGSREHALPNNLNVSIEGIDGAALFARLRNVAVSNASACLNGAQDFSQVLSELGVSKGLARATLRFGIGRFNTEEEILAASREIIAVVRDLRRIERDFARASGETYMSGRCDS